MILGVTQVSPSGRPLRGSAQALSTSSKALSKVTRVVGLAHHAAHALGDVVLAEEKDHALAPRPPLERADVAPRKKSASRSGDDALRGDVAAYAGEGVGPRSRRRLARYLCPAAGNVRRRVPQQERQVGDPLGVTGVRRAHQPAQQLLLQGLAEQAAPAGGERFVALLGDNLQIRRGDVGQLDYSQEEAVLRTAGLGFGTCRSGLTKLQTSRVPVRPWQTR